ncbi:MAG: mannose-1-phosphate guanylyltransferase [Myxococcota bacterium]
MRRSLMARIDDSLQAVILAGGAGERFWPASRHAHPKPFLRVINEGGKNGRSTTLLGATLARARRFAEPDRTWVVCGVEHASTVKSESGLPARQILAEPMRRNTAMAIALAAVRIRAEDPNAVMVVLPSDHVIPDGRAFAAAIRKAGRAARDASVLVTLGVEPKRADTGLGYIQLGPAVDDAAKGGLHRVQRFVEKPDERTARRYLRQGGYLWNAGIFVWSVQTILEELETCASDLFEALGSLLSAGWRPTRRAIAASYRRVPSVPIDVAVLEKSRRVWTLPLRLHWSDVGTWASLAEELGVRLGSSKIIDGQLVECNSDANLVWAEGKAVALLGVEGLVVIDTPDALLVARLDESPGLRKVVAHLKANGRADLT